MPIRKNLDSNASVPPRIQELQKKIADESYIMNAVDRIATVVSRQLIERQSFPCRHTEIIIQ